MKYSMKHNIMAILISVLMVFAMMPVMSGAVFADSIQSEGNCGARESESDPCADNAKYTFDESSGALVISGTGEIGKTPAENWPAEFKVDYVRCYQYNRLLG